MYLLLTLKVGDVIVPSLVSPPKNVFTSWLPRKAGGPGLFDWALPTKSPVVVQPKRRKGVSTLEILENCSRWRYAGIECAVGGKLFSVKLANEVLSTRAAGDGARIHVHHKHPLVVTWLLPFVTILRLHVLPWCDPPSTGNSNRSGHSQTPPTALAGPKSLSLVQFLRSVEE